MPTGSEYLSTPENEISINGSIIDKPNRKIGITKQYNTGIFVNNQNPDVGHLGGGFPIKVNSTGDAPEWAYFGAINNVFYVSTVNGIDTPAPDYGVTLDRPWKTIRYACEQVQDGAIRNNARSLLERNRSFIQDEVIEFIDATYPSLTYVQDTCRRDVGQVLDAAIWDLSHGGNERSVQAAKSYFAADGTTYLADNAAETAAGLNYIKTVTDAVLSNVAPATVRGSLNQVIDTTKTEGELGLLAWGLVGVIVGAVIASLLGIG